MNLFYFTQIFPVVPKFEQNCFNHPIRLEVVGICPNVYDCIQISMQFLYMTQLEWSCLKLPKLE